MNYRTISTFRNIIEAGIKKAFEQKIDFTVALWAKAFAYGLSEALYSLQSVLKTAFLQLFPQNAKGEFLDMWGEWEGLEKKTGNRASGTITFVGDTTGVTVSYSTLLQATNGLLYNTTESGETSLVSKTVTDFYIADGVAYAETGTAHGFATGQKPTHTLVTLGEVIAENGITVTSTTEYTFLVDLDPITGETGTVEEYMVTLESECQEVGTDGNIETGTLSVLDDIDDLNESCYVNSEIKDGTDEEKVEDWRARIMLSRSQMRGAFSEDQITTAALEIDGNDRIVIDRPVPGVDDTTKTAGFQPRPGEVVVYVIRDTDSGIESPVTASILTETKNAIMENGKLPANTAEDDLYVFSPLLQDVDITISITPDTATMRTALENQLDAFFYDNEDIDSDIDINDLKAAISNTYDFETGTALESYNLTSPESITITSKYIPQKGTITYV